MNLLASNFFRKTGFVVTVIIIVGVTLWQLFGSSAKPETAPDLNVLIDVSRYESSLKNLEKIFASFDTDLFKRTSFVMLKSFVSLPLELGRVGKDDPFGAPPAPEDLLLQNEKKPGSGLQ